MQRDSSHFKKNLRLNHKMRQRMKRIVIIGGGFAGLAAAKALGHSKADVLVIDRANHNLFQPLLYQVATTVLSPAQNASPIRVRVIAECGLAWTSDTAGLRSS
jgi:NADPH-dependent 2,4-dienoyl-CoA reductase/sulfur reductase-like enzyme